MRANRYAGVLDPWKERLIVRRVRRRGLVGSDLDEVVQRIVLELLEFRFDAERSNGATEATAITSIVDRQVAYYCRGESTYRRHCDAATVREEPIADDRESCDLALDVREAIGNLPEFSQQICEALGSGLSVAETARKLGVGWHRIDQEIRRIRRYFERAGLNMPRGADDARESAA